MIVDFYCWLENDVCIDVKVCDWVMVENKVIDVYLVMLFGCEVFKVWMQMFYNYEWMGML